MGGTVGRHSGAQTLARGRHRVAGGAATGTGEQRPKRSHEKRRSASLPNVFVFADEDDTEYEYDTENDLEGEGMATIG